MELIEKLMQEIENLKAAEATRVSSQQLVNAMSQAMSCLYVGTKQTPTENTSNSGKKFMGYGDTQTT